jgi:hypothetical protein
MANQEELFGFTPEGLQQEVDKVLPKKPSDDELVFSNESYVSKAEGRTFMELLGDPEFENDLRLFFKNHDLYTMSDEEIEKVGITQLANDFVEHIRFQDMNEYVAVQDLLFSQRPEDEVDPESILAFGRLDHALEVSEGGGTGFIEGFSDYFRGYASSPTTIATVGSLGYGVWTKIGAYFGKKGTQLALKKRLKGLLRDGITDEVIKKTVKKDFIKDALISRDNLLSTGFDTGVAVLHSGAQGETRENTRPGYEYDMGDVIRDAALQGSLQHVVGTGAKSWDNYNFNKSVDGLLEMTKKSEEFTKAQRKAAFETFKNGSTENINEQASSIAELVSIFEARSQGKPVDLAELDRTSVERGRELFQQMLSDPTDAAIVPGLSLDTIRGVTAAGVELREVLKKYATPGKRISQIVSDAVAAGDFTPRELIAIRTKYGLSTDELGYLWLAEFSKAGSTLAEAANLTRFVQQEFTQLAKGGIETPSDRAVAEIIDPLISSKNLRDIDNFTIALMTIQTGTTGANVLSGAFRLGVVNTLDQTWDVLGTSLYGLSKGQLPDKNWLGSMLSNVKSMTWGTSEAKLLDELFKADMPTAYQELFYDTSRILESAGNGRGRLNTVARALNALNTGTDAVLKQMAFYASIDKQLRALGDTTTGRGNVSEFLQNYSSLQELPEGVVDKAMQEAKEVTYQITYKGDESLFATKFATPFQKLHFKVPGLVSKIFGIPFPRFVANHLETVGDYTGFAAAAYGIEKGARTMFPWAQPENKYFTDAYKTGKDRWKRSMTGFSLMGMGAYSAFATNGESPYDRDILAPLSEQILGEMATTEQDYSRALGTYLAPVFIGDFAARWYMGQREFKLTEADEEVFKEMLGGMAEVGFDAGLIENLRVVYEEGTGNFPQGLQTFLGDQLALLTYATKPAADIMRNAEYYRSGSPYVKDYYGGDPRAPSTFGERTWWEGIATRGLAWNRAMRFVPDVGGIQGMSDDIRPGKVAKADGFYAVANYNGTSKYRTGGFSPITSQFGVNTEAPLNDFEIELNKVGIVPWKTISKSSTNRNPIVDQLKKQILSIGLRTRGGERLQVSISEQFDVFRSTPLKDLGGITYDKIADPKTRARVLTKFMESRVKAAEKIASDIYVARMQNPEKYSRELTGFIRHMYSLEKRKLGQQKYSFDDVVKFGMQNTRVGQALKIKGYDYTNSRDFIVDAASVEDEVHRRNLLLSEWLPAFKEANNITVETEQTVQR